MHRKNLDRCFKEVLINKESFGVELFPHQALHNTRYVHWQRIEDNTQRSNPEVEVGEFIRIQLCIPHARNNPVKNTKNQEAIPAESAYVYVRNNPVGEVGDSV